MEEKYALELIEKGKRIDGREFNQFREIKIQKGIVEKAEGSAWVRLGETQVIAGVKLEVGEPFPDTPEEGVLIVNAEFTPLASPDFEAGPPGEDAVELARIVDRGIRESKCIKLDELVITPGEKVWCVWVDIHVINHKGNLLDAACLAALAALLNTRIPKIENGEVVRGKYEGNLPIAHKPVNISVGKIGNSFILDPSIQEEVVLDAKLSVTVREDGKICAIQKQGNKGIEFEEIEKMIDLALEKSKEIREMIDSFG